MANPADSSEDRPVQGFARLVRFLRPSHQHSAFSATLLLMSAVMLSRVIGYVREAYIAYAFGAGPATDAYVAGFTIPDWLNYLVAGGTASITFVSIYTRFLAEKKEDEAQKTFSVIITVMTAVLGVGILAGGSFHAADLASALPQVQSGTDAAVRASDSHFTSCAVVLLCGWGRFCGIAFPAAFSFSGLWATDLQRGYHSWEACCFRIVWDYVPRVWRSRGQFSRTFPYQCYRRGSCRNWLQYFVRYSQLRFPRVGPAVDSPDAGSVAGYGRRLDPALLRLRRQWGISPA